MTYDFLVPDIAIIAAHFSPIASQFIKEMAFRLP